MSAYDPTQTLASLFALVLNRGSFTVTARIRARPDLCSSIEVASSLNIRSTLPASRSLTAGAVPL